MEEGIIFPSVCIKCEVPIKKLGRVPINQCIISVYAGLTSEENSKLNRLESRFEAKDIKEIA